MDLYLAATNTSGCMRFFWKYMELYLASATDKRLIPSLMYLAGENGKGKIMETEIYLFLKKLQSNLWENILALESFYYAKNNSKFPTLYKCGAYKKILLDSGAFTFLSKSQSNVNWEKYIEEYAEFINYYGIDLFFELDIDKIVGLDRVEKMRDKLESLTGKKPIPVWHKNRGKDYFVEMCKKYPYVAIGGYVSKEVPAKTYELAFPWFIQTAHQNGAKIHGLGYTRTERLKEFHFDSVDSTAWLHGNIGGFIYKFDYQRGFMGKEKRDTKTRVKGHFAAIYNFNEWLKFQDYARKFL